jgi:ribosomal protein S18 acetylase RimI-like enzyme
MTTIRRIRADEWEKVRMLRLAALADPAAPIAFLETLEDALGRPAEFWESRAAGAATGPTAQFVAVAPSGEWLGTLVVLVLEAGTEDYWGHPVHGQRASVVGVFVKPEARGTGLIDQLMAAAKEYAVSQGFEELRLEVHRNNARARAAYERAGFVATGDVIESECGPDAVMVASLR